MCPLETERENAAHADGHRRPGRAFRPAKPAGLIYHISPETPELFDT